MQQTGTSGPPCAFAQPAATALVAKLTGTTISTATPPETGAGSGERTACVTQLTRTHLGRLQSIQAVCENQTGQTSVLSVADVALALRGLERYFTPLFERYQLSLAQVRETLQWAEDECGSTTLVEEVIQRLVARIWEEQYLRRRLARGRNA